MATVVNQYPDQRAEKAGAGLGALAAFFYQRKKKDELDRKAQEIANQIAVAPDYDSAVTVLNTADPKVLELHGDRLRQSVQDKYRKQQIVTGYDPSGAQTGVVVKEGDDIQKQLEMAGVNLKGPSPAWGVEIDGNMDTAPDEATANQRVQDALKRGGRGRTIKPPQVDAELTLYKIEQDAITDRVKARNSGENKTQDWEATMQATFLAEAAADSIVAANGIAGAKNLDENKSYIDSHFKTNYGTLGEGGVVFQSPGKGKQYEVAKNTSNKIIVRGGDITTAIKAGQTAGDLQILDSMLDNTTTGDVKKDSEALVKMATDKATVDMQFQKEFGLTLSDMYKTKIQIEGQRPAEYNPRDKNTVHSVPIVKGGASVGTLRFIVVSGKFIPLQRVDND